MKVINGNCDLYISGFCICDVGIYQTDDGNWSIYKNNSFNRNYITVFNPQDYDIKFKEGYYNNTLCELIKK